jgi:hypothetical protein
LDNIVKKLKIVLHLFALSTKNILKAVQVSQFMAEKKDWHLIDGKLDLIQKNLTIEHS